MNDKEKYDVVWGGTTSKGQITPADELEVDVKDEWKDLDDALLESFKNRRKSVYSLINLSFTDDSVDALSYALRREFNLGGNMNIAKIRYYEQDGQFYYEGWENLLTKQEIIDKYGKGVWNKYKNKYPSMILERGEAEYIELREDCDCQFNECLLIDKNSGYPQDRFQELNSLMKQAGKNLVECIRKVDEKRVKTFEI